MKRILCASNVGFSDSDDLHADTNIGSDSRVKKNDVLYERLFKPARNASVKSN